jgi:hypothetical protein
MSKLFRRLKAQLKGVIDRAVEEKVAAMRASGELLPDHAHGCHPAHGDITGPPIRVGGGS